ncbi:MAG: PEP-CTERM sorting domain-containing protein [bacterium]|nr:PEP-CTERM sorting domain-containing protein [bacterium]
MMVTDLQVRKLMKRNQQEKNDLTQRGAENAADPARWSVSNYAAAASVAVLELPGVDASKSGPETRQQIGDQFSYRLELTNYGNSPNNGWYLVDRLPRNGVNNSEFTPEYGQVYLDQAPEDVIIEYSTDAVCFNDPLKDSWTMIPLQSTTRPDYLAETIENIAPDVLCLRLRRNPDATGNFAPGDTIVGSLDVMIPNDPSLEGRWLYNRALTGAATAFGAGTGIDPVETVNVRTLVKSPDIAMGILKTFEIDQSSPGWIAWKIQVYNTSESPAVNISLVDELPNELIYEGLAEALPAGWTLVEEPGESSPGGQLRIMIPQLSVDDGIPGSGDDEAVISFRTRVVDGTPDETEISNCAAVSPETGLGDQSCVSINTPSPDPTPTPGNVIPGPSTLILLGIGLFGLLALVRRRGKKREYGITKNPLKGVGKPFRVGSHMLLSCPGYNNSTGFVKCCFGSAQHDRHSERSRRGKNYTIILSTDFFNFELLFFGNPLIMGNSRIVK